MPRRINAVLPLLSAALFVPAPAHAFCPVCAIAAGAGLGIARRLGVDDTISGLWAGGLLVALTMWTIEWVEKRELKFFLYKPALALCYWLMTLVPLYGAGIVFNPQSRLRGADKTALGMALGALSFYACGKWYQRLKSANGGHAYFPFQKVAMPLTPLVLLSVAFYLITRG